MSRYPKPASGHCCTSLSVLCLTLVMAVCCRAVADPEPVSGEHFRELDIEIQALKKEVLKVNRDLQELETELLYPHGQQLVVFVSMVSEAPMRLNDIRLQLDGKTVAAHAYTPGEETALHEGGVHRIYVGGIRPGEHTLEAVVAGTGPHGAEFNHRESATITKVPGTRYVELRIHADSDGRQPAVSILAW
jgi:hypothetical protein